MNILSAITSAVPTAIGAAVVGAIAGLIGMYQTSELKDQAEREGQLKAAIVQKEQAIEQARQQAEEAEQERARIEAQRLSDLEAMAERLSATEDTLHRANERLDRFAAMEETSEGFKAWAVVRHPVELNGLLNDPAPELGPARTDNPDGDEGSTSTGEIDSAVPHE